MIQELYCGRLVWTIMHIGWAALIWSRYLQRTSQGWASTARSSQKYQFHSSARKCQTSCCTTTVNSFVGPQSHQTPMVYTGTASNGLQVNRKLKPAWGNCDCRMEQLPKRKFQKVDGEYFQSLCWSYQSQQKSHKLLMIL